MKKPHFQSISLKTRLSSNNICSRISQALLEIKVPSMNPQESDFEEFIHALSHDIKNILHNIHAYADLLEEDNDPEFIEGIVKLVKKAREVLNSYVTLADKGEYTTRP